MGLKDVAWILDNIDMLSKGQTLEQLQRKLHVARWNMNYYLARPRREWHYIMEPFCGLSFFQTFAKDLEDEGYYVPCWHIGRAYNQYMEAYK